MYHSPLDSSGVEAFYKKVFRILSYTCIPVLALALIADYFKFGSFKELQAGLMSKEARWTIFAISYSMAAYLGYFIQSMRAEFAKDFEKADKKQKNNR